MATNLTSMMAQSQDFSTTKSHESGHKDHFTYQTCRTYNSAKPMASKFGRIVAQIEIFSSTLSFDIPSTKLHELPIMIRFYLQLYIHKAYGADGNFLQSVSKKKLLRSFHSTYQDDFSVFYGNKSISLLGSRIRDMIQDSLKKS